MNRGIKNIMQIFLILLLLFTSIKVFAEDNLISIYYDKEIGQINNKVYGNNIIAYDPMTYENWAEEYYGYSDYGAGIWDPKWKQPVKEVVDLAKEAGITIMRFPGGCGTHHYNWRNVVEKEREHFLYGIDEFLKTCKEIKAEPVITMSYFTGNEQDAADLVKYLQGKVKYFEIGNEVWHGNHQEIEEVSPQEYARKYLKYYSAMKAIDTTIKIGVVLHHSEDRNRPLLKIVQDKLDFGIIHTYPSSPWGKELEQTPPKEIFKRTLAIPVYREGSKFQNILKLLKENANKDIPLSITEYNGGFIQNKPVPYRHCLGTALLNAELLRIFMKPEHNILMANYWQFCNSYWGMVKSQQNFMEHDYRYPITYIKRPNYYVFELYHKHFGSNLIEADIKCDAYKVKGNSVPYLSVNASKSTNGKKVFLMVINKNLEESITATLDLKDFTPKKTGDAWVLNGPSVDATNEEDSNNVKVAHKEIKIEANPFQFTFEPHSLTAIEIRKK
jgi:alpha-N-arabinofuranosidase